MATVAPVGMAMELVPPALAVEPGRLGRMEVHLRNGGREPSQIAVEVPAGERDWSWVHPESCTVGSGEEAVVSVFFKPACGAHPTAGRHAVEIVARTTGSGEAAAKGQGTVEVGPWMDAAGALDPMVAHDQRGHSYTLTFENRGNVPVSASLSTDDPSGALDVAVQPDRVSVEPGGTATAAVEVQARKKLKRGEQRYRVCVLAQVDEGPELRIEGAFYHLGLKAAKR